MLDPDPDSMNMDPKHCKHSSNHRAADQWTELVNRLILSFNTFSTMFPLLRVPDHLSENYLDLTIPVPVLLKK